MEIRKVEQINKLLIEQYNKINIQTNKASNEADISKELETKVDLLSNMKGENIDLILKEEVPVYDKNGNIVNSKVHNEILTEDLKLSDTFESTNKSLPIINQQTIPNEDMGKATFFADKGIAEYFTAVYNLVRNRFLIGNQDYSTKTPNKYGFKFFGLYGIVLFFMIIFYFLIIK